VVLQAERGVEVALDVQPPVEVGIGQRNRPALEDQVAQHRRVAQHQREGRRGAVGVLAEGMGHVVPEPQRNRTFEASQQLLDDAGRGLGEAGVDAGGGQRRGR